MRTAYAIDAEGHLSHEVCGDFDDTGLVMEPPPSTLVRPRWNGKSWVESASNKARSSALDAHIGRALGMLQTEAERVREVIRPAGVHAAAVQEQKLREARAILYGCCKEEPILLSTQAGLSGVDIKALASQLIESHYQWCKQMARIEEILFKYNARILKDRERGTVTKVADAGRAALWALVMPTGVGVPSTEYDIAETEPDTTTKELTSEVATVIAIKDPRTDSAPAEIVIKDVRTERVDDPTARRSTLSSETIKE